MIQKIGVLSLGITVANHTVVIISTLLRLTSINCRTNGRGLPMPTIGADRYQRHGIACSWRKSVIENKLQMLVNVVKDIAFLYNHHIDILNKRLS